MADQPRERRRRRSASSSGTSKQERRLEPMDPIVSVYPLPLDEHRAKDEAVRARRLGKRLPMGHPYRKLPLWVPYWLARLIAGSAVSSKPTAGER